VEKYNKGGQATDDSIKRRMRLACWMPKATDTRSKCMILIALALQQWFHERASVLRYAYIACLVKCSWNTSYFRGL